MASPSRSQLEKEALKAFRSSKPGRLLTNVYRQVNSGKATPQYLRREARKLSAITGLSLASELMEAMGMKEEYDLIARYAGRENTMKRLFGRVLGKTGQLLGSMLFGKKVQGPPVHKALEFEVAANLLKAAGYGVTPPGGKPLPGFIALEDDLQSILEAALQAAKNQTPETKRKIQEMLDDINNPPVQPTKPEKGGMFEEWQGETPDRGQPKSKPSGPGSQFKGGAPQMIPVSSSNVHSIGFRQETDYEGTLFVRYLNDLGNGRRGGPGSLYEYYNVPATLFNRFRIAGSKGGFVWDELRVRGTVSGFQYAYDLAGVVGNYRVPTGYVPRRAQAQMGRGPRGGKTAREMFVERSFNIGEIRKGRMTMRRQRSQLPTQQVGGVYGVRSR